MLQSESMADSDIDNSYPVVNRENSDSLENRVHIEDTKNSSNNISTWKQNNYFLFYN